MSLLRPSGRALLRRHLSAAGIVVRGAPTAESSIPWALLLGGVAVLGVTLYVVNKSGEREEVTDRRISYDDLWHQAVRATRDQGRSRTQQARLDAWLQRRQAASAARRENEW